MLFCATRTGFNLRRTPAELPEARHWCERAVEFARVAGDASILAGTLSNLADVVKDLGQYEYARALYLETMRLFEDAGNQENAAWSLSHQADLCRQQGDDGQKYLELLDMIKSIEQTPIPKIEKEDPAAEAEANEEEILVEALFPGGAGPPPAAASRPGF